MSLSQLITTTDVVNSNVGINNVAANGVTYAVVLGDGQNVGIGTNAPVSGLHIGSTTTTIPALYIADSTSITLPTVATNDGMFSVLAGVPTFTNSTGTVALVTEQSGQETGTATLAGTTGTVVSNANITATSTVLVTRNTGTNAASAVVNVGTITVGSVIAGVSFTLYSTVESDVDNVNYLIIN